MREPFELTEPHAWAESYLGWGGLQLVPLFYILS